MRVYAGMDPRLALRDVAAYAARIEAMGYDGLQVPETVHDGLAVALLALEHTTRITVRTSVTLAFVRSPMLVAYTAWDLQQFSSGRFALGLGTQIRPNIEDRYGMPWTEPVGRLRDFVGAVQAAFAAFSTGERPVYRSANYRITRLQPYFDPGPLVHPAPPVWLGGVNAGVCRLAGEVAAGFVTHPTNSNRRYLDAICCPSIAAGAAAAGRPVGDIALVVGTPVITGATDADVAGERERQRGLLAFLYSTPAYRRTLELYGWHEVGERLQAMTRAGEWSSLAALVTDEMLDELVPQARYDQLASTLRSCLGAVASGVVVPAPLDPADDQKVRAVIEELRGDTVRQWKPT